MKSFLLSLLILVVTTVGAIAQNYQPIYSNSLQVFYQENGFSKFELYLNEPFLHNMWGTRIDSVEISTSGDTILHNYPILRDTIAEYQLDSTQNCGWWNAPNWSGDEIIIDTGLGAVFQNMWGDSIHIKYDTPIGESWLAFEYDSGDSLVCMVDSVAWKDDEWVSDSVKYISMQRLNNGTVESDSVNLVRLEFYKHHGIRSTVDFLRFPFSYIQLHRLNINLIDKNSAPYYIGPGPLSDFNSAPYPNIGDGFCVYQRVIDYPTNQTTTEIWSRSITSVTPWIGDGQLSVGVSDLSSDLLYIPNTDSTFATLVEGFVDGSTASLMPKELGAGYRYMSSQSSCPNMVAFSNCVPNSFNLTEDSCIQRPFLAGCYTGSVKVFLPEYGLISSNYWSDDPVYGLGVRIWYEKTCLKFGEYECGPVHTIGITEKTKDQPLQILPSPANQSFKIESIVAFDQLSIYNLQGQLVWKSESQLSSYSVDCSQWPNGIYVIRSVSDGRLQHQKLIVSH